MNLFTLLFGFFSSLLPSLPEKVCEGDGCLTHEILEVWKRFRPFDVTFDVEGFYDRLETCFESDVGKSANLAAFSDRTWQIFLDYGNQRGVEGDKWNERDLVEFFEFDPTPLNTANDGDLFVKSLSDLSRIPAESATIPIQEPCNSVSNIAFLRAVFNLCEMDTDWTLDKDVLGALLTSFTLLSTGSTIFHASGTTLGQRLDQEGISLITFILLQGGLQGLTLNPVLNLEAIRPGPPFLSAVQIAQEVNRLIFEQQDLSLLEGDLLDLGVISNEQGTTLLLVSSLAFILQSLEAVEAVLGSLADALTVNENSSDFVFGEYLPALITTLEEEDVSLSETTRKNLLGIFLSAFLKLLFAIGFQETVVGQSLTDSVLLNFLGGASLGQINALANNLSQAGQNERDPVFQLSSAGVYPGDLTCQFEQFHAKWHELSSNGLLDLAILADSFASVIQGNEIVVDGSNPLRDTVLDCVIASFDDLGGVSDPSLFGLLDYCTPQ